MTGLTHPPCRVGIAHLTPTDSVNPRHLRKSYMINNHPEYPIIGQNPVENIK